MRVLHVVQPPRGGAPALVEMLVRRQLARHEVGVVCRLAVARRIAGSGARVWVLPMDRRVRATDFRELVRLTRVVASYRPDVIHAHSSKAGVLARLAGRATGTPVIFSPHNFSYRIYEGPAPVRLAFLAIERLLAPLTAHLQVSYQAEYYDALRVGTGTSRNTSVVPNGIETGPLLKLPKPTGDPLCVGTYARLWPQKSIDVLLRSAAICLRRGLAFDVLIIGEGPLRTSLMALASELGIEGRTRFLDDPGGAVAALASLDVFVLSSSVEATPLALMEAMAAGRTVIATRVGGVSGMVNDGETGLLVEPNDTGALAAAIGRIVTDASLRGRLAAAGRRTAEARFDVAATASAFDAIYEAVLANGQTTPGICFPPLNLGGSVDSADRCLQ